MSSSRIRGPKQFNPNVLFGRTASGRGEGHEIPFREFAAKIKPLLGISSTPTSSSSSGGGGTGDVVGPSSATDGDIAQFDGATGKLLKDGGLSSASFDAAGAAATAQSNAEAYADTGDNAVKALRASSSVFGLCKVDNSSITATGGVISATGFAPSGVQFHPGIQSGRWYTTPIAVFGGSGGALSVNILYASPIYLPETTTFTQCGVQITTAAAAGKLGEIGIYSNNHGIPDTLEFDSGSFAVDATGTKGVSGLSWTLAAGWHWIVFATNGAPVVSVFGSGSSPTWLMGASTLNTLSNQVITGSWTFSAGTMPASFGTVTYATSPLLLLGLLK